MEGIMQTELVSFAGGLVTMALLDPRRGGARRAWLREKAVRAKHTLGHSAGVVGRDLRNRSHGMVAKFQTHEPESDEVLSERVRARIGHICSHPRSIEVRSREGVVEVKGPILASERQRVLWAVAGVEGVHGIDDDLEPHETADIPQLQGGVERRAPLLHTNAPAVRFMMALGVGLFASGAALAVRALLPTRR
jgi:hypothetical protein